MSAVGKNDPKQNEGVMLGLAETWPDAVCELLAKDPWELLVAVILSARTSDERVNQVMANFTEHYIGPCPIADMDPHELEPMIKSVPLYQQKARYIVESARMLVYKYDGEMPRDLKTLQLFPGVGRKTAAVVLGNAFNIPTIAADVHVQRIAARLSWSRVDPDDAERSISERVPEQHWVTFCHQLIRLGRAFCRPKRPWCSRCPIQEFCPQHDVEEWR